MVDTPAKKVSKKDAINHYATGPPYLATTRAMRRIAQKWAEFVPRSHKEKPELMAEMYAYCIAAAHPSGVANGVRCGSTRFGRLETSECD